MDRQEIFEKVKEVLVAQFGEQAKSATENTVAQDIRGWDSFAHVVLLGTVEKKFGMKFGFNEIVNFTSVGAIVDTLERKINK
ncbi:MAG: acyl carrier protein [Clostridia bacterium]|nr:acyl carrier protein [Clostridia bacterium]